jgi:hypothetical protein
MAEEKNMELRSSIVGSSFYPGAGNIIMRLRPGAALRLKREPDNKYDKNAIAVFFSETKLGHIGRGLAALLAPRMDAGLVINCTKHPANGAVVVLSWDEAMAPAEAPDIAAESESQKNLMLRFKGLGL